MSDAYKTQDAMSLRWLGASAGRQATTILTQGANSSTLLRASGSINPVQ
jgi:hypothetical protein